MVMEIDVPRDDGPLSLDDFIARVEERGCDWDDRACLIEIAPDLARLARNRTFLPELMFRELADAAEFQARNFYGPNVFILHSCQDYFLRANVWKPVSQVEQSIEGFRYDICHDHNFDILTIGYHGPGYRSRIYRYDASRVEGVLGERVDMTPEGEVTLTQGRVLLYRAKQDVHIQLPPDALSVSLNLIPRNAWIHAPQFQFDEETGTICRYLHTAGSELITRLAATVGGAPVLDALDRIMRTHPGAHVRALAAVSRVALAPGEREEVRRWLNRWAGAAERSIFEMETESPGACLRMHAPKTVSFSI